MNNVDWLAVETPLGRFVLGAQGPEVVRVLLPGRGPDEERLEDSGLKAALRHDPHNAFLTDVAQQVREFATGARRGLDVPHRLAGAGFNHAVWQAMGEIPYGQTVTYGELAASVGSPGAARAAGNACNKNPVPLVVPCHRVVASNGLGGFGGGEELKRALLRMEGSWPAGAERQPFEYRS